MSTTAPSSEPTLRCARHPGVETVLRCGRCDTPICPRCLVSTPVGARCPTCARVKRFALLLKPAELARAAGLGLAAAAAGALILALVPILQILGIIGLALLGFLVGEAVSIGANRKRARELGPVAVICLFVGYPLGLAIAFWLQLGGQVSPGPELLLAAVRQVIFGRGLVLIGALLAWMRVR